MWSGDYTCLYESASDNPPQSVLRRCKSPHSFTTVFQRSTPGKLIRSTLDVSFSGFWLSPHGVFFKRWISQRTELCVWVRYLRCLEYKTVEHQLPTQYRHALRLMNPRHPAMTGHTLKPNYVLRGQRQFNSANVNFVLLTLRCWLEELGLQRVLKIYWEACHKDVEFYIHIL